MKYLFISTFIFLISPNKSWTQVKRSDSLELLQFNRAVLPESAGGPLPGHVDLSDNLPIGGDQCITNSCVSYACVYSLFSYIYARDNHLGYNFNVNGHIDKSKIFSPFYTFHYLKTNPDCTKSSSTISKTMHFIGLNGIPFLSQFEVDPCDPNNCNATPPDSATGTTFSKNTLKNFAWAYSDIYSPARVVPSILLQRYLNAQIVNVVIMDMPGDFANFTKVDENFVLNENYPKTENIVHAMVCTGYDRVKNALRFVNSAGDDWGFHGKIWISCDVVNAHLIESWVMNIDKDQLIEGHQRIFQRVNDTIVPIGTDFYLNIFDNLYKKVDGFLISGTRISAVSSKIKIIRTGADNLDYVSVIPLSTKSKSDKSYKLSLAQLPDYLLNIDVPKQAAIDNQNSPNFKMLIKKTKIF